MTLVKGTATSCPSRSWLFIPHFLKLLRDTLVLLGVGSSISYDVANHDCETRNETWKNLATVELQLTSEAITRAGCVVV